MKLLRSLILLSIALGFAPTVLRLAPPVLAAPAATPKQLYTCGMHPQIIKDAPGNCPICGMKLTPVRANTAGGPQPAAPSGERKVKYYKSTMIPGQVSPQPAKDTMGMDMAPVYEDEDASAENTIQIDPRTIQRMNLKTAAVTRGPVRRELRAVGTVAFNERGLRDVTTKYEGWIERLHVNSPWTPVQPGDLLFEIYSPDLYNAQLNYLVALRTEGDAGGPLTRASLARLQLFDVAPEFLAELARTGTARRTYPLRAPAGGYVIEKMAVEGQMARPGEKLYRLADLSSVWILAQIYEQDMPFVHDGQSATVRLSYGATRDFPATVDMVVPQVEELTRTATARLVLANPGAALRPGMFVEVRLAAELAADAVLVPDVAVLRSGEHNTVFVALPDGAFAPREVKLGARSEGNFYQVLSGLAAGDRVVTSGQFMLDSESQLREAIQKMLRAPDAASATESDHDHAPHEGDGHDHADPGREPADPTAAASSDALLPVAFAAADAAAALAQDDLAAYRRLLPALRETLTTYLQKAPHGEPGPLAKFSGQLADPADLAAARRGFEPFSTAVADLARAQHLHHREDLRLFECSMSPVLGTGRWLQRTDPVANPFFGSAMPQCGERLDPAPDHPDAPAGSGGMAALPAGHPPIAGLAIADYLRQLPATAAGSSATPPSGGCGGCGMNAAAMAAGEPCPPEPAK